METDETGPLRRWQEDGDVDALEALLRGELARLKLRLRGPRAPGSPGPQSQDDVAQEAVMRLLRASPPPRFPTRSALQGYLWTAARHLLIDRMRRGSHHYQELGSESSDDLTAEPATRGSVERIEREDLATALELALNLMRPADREILHLVYFDGNSIEAAAGRLGVDRAVANTRLVRARLRLAQKLDSWREFLGE